MKEFNLEIITPSKIAYSELVSSVTVPGTIGEFQVLYNHAPLVSTLEIGRIKIKSKDTEEIYATSGGTIEVLDNKVLILVDSIEKASDINVERAKKAAERANHRLSNKKNDVDIVRAEAALRRALNRIKIAGE